ncbi:MAG: FHA domain-containing protein [Desulfurococcaceae archaeon]
MSKKNAGRANKQAKRIEESPTTNMQILVLIVRSMSGPTQQVVKFKPGDYTVGRDPTCDVVILDPYVSRKHMRIFNREGTWFVEDLGSRNGTFVNGENIQGRGPVELRAGMEIVLGFSVLVVKGFEQG